MCLDKFQIKPCHRRWSSILNPYVDRRDKLKWIIIKGWGKKEKKKRSKLTERRQSRPPLASAIISSLNCFCSRSISVEYWMDIAAMLRLVNWSGMTVSRLRQQADLDICLSFLCRFIMWSRKGKETRRTYTHSQDKTRELFKFIENTCLQRIISTSQGNLMSEILCRNECQKGMNGY